MSIRQASCPSDVRSATYLSAEDDHANQSPMNNRRTPRANDSGSRLCKRENTVTSAGKDICDASLLRRAMKSPTPRRPTADKKRAGADKFAESLQIIIIGHQLRSCAVRA